MTKERLNTKAESVYVMLDRKGINLALVKTGLTADTFRNRFHCYKTSNPWLQCVAVANLRKGQNLKKVEKMFHKALAENFELVCGEWYKITDSALIDEIEKDGFQFFGKHLNWYIKNKEMINTTIAELW